MLRPACREAIGGETEDPAAEREDEGEDDLELTRQRAPANASSTSVACVTPLAPRAANGIVLRK